MVGAEADDVEDGGGDEDVGRYPKQLAAKDQMNLNCFNTMPLLLNLWKRQVIISVDFDFVPKSTKKRTKKCQKLPKSTNKYQKYQKVPKKFLQKVILETCDIWDTDYILTIENLNS